MSHFAVRSGDLRRYGHDFETFAQACVQPTADFTRTECARTDDFNGLLELVAPAVREVADTFAGHYDDLTDVVKGTGTSLAKLASTYAKLDQATAEAMDRHAARAGNQTDIPLGHGGAFVQNPVLGQCHGASPDPSQEIRDNMAIDVRAIDWVFNKFTGHHITEPLDKAVGNWTALSARGDAWGDVYDMLNQYGEDILTNTSTVDLVWDGVAATTFKEYGTRLGNGFKGEAAIPMAIQKGLDQVAEEWESLYKQAVDLLQDVIHDVELAAAFLAAGWWCGLGEAAAAEECGQAGFAWWQAVKVAWRIHSLIKMLTLAVKGFEKLKDLYHLATHIPEAVDGAIDDVKEQLGEFGDIIDTLTHLQDIPAEPTSPYGGPDDPGIK